MSDDVKEYLDPGKKNLILIYILYLCGLNNTRIANCWSCICICKSRAAE
jgi:uncharacterized membrane protein